MNTSSIESTPQPAGYRETTPQQLHAVLGQLRVVDVREPSEYRGELGHIVGAELVPLATLADASATWDRSATVIVVCRSGKRSARAASQLAQAGFRDILDLSGGMMAWVEAGLPVEA